MHVPAGLAFMAGLPPQVCLHLALKLLGHIVDRHHQGLSIFNAGGAQKVTVRGLVVNDRGRDARGHPQARELEQVRSQCVGSDRS